MSFSVDVKKQKEGVYLVQPEGRLDSVTYPLFKESITPLLNKPLKALIFDMNKLTAAHNKLPFGTHVRVTNLKNQKSVVVKINDRGPFVRGRVIDLSYAAAKKIGMVKDGVTKVKIEIVG